MNELVFVACCLFSEPCAFEALLRGARAWISEWMKEDWK